MSTTITSTSFTLPAATPTLLLALDPTRRSLLRSVSSGVATFKFGSAPASATDGVVIDPTSTAGGRLLITGADTPVDAVYAYSTSGASIVIEVGKAY